MKMGPTIYSALAPALVLMCGTPVDKEIAAYLDNSYTQMWSRVSAC